MNPTNDRRRKSALILAAHGSSQDERINRPMIQLASQIGRQSDFSTVTAAFLDGQPDIRTIIGDIDEDHVVVIPFMASAGYYTDVVFPKALASSTKSIDFTPPIGVYPLIPQWVQSRIKSVAKRYPAAAESTIILIGHGTRKNRNSCRSTIELVQDLRLLLDARQIEFGFIDQNPTLDHVAKRHASENLLIIPFLMGIGPHVTQDIPNAFGLNDFEHRFFDSLPHEGFEASRSLDGIQPFSAGSSIETLFPYFGKNHPGDDGDSTQVLYDAPIGLYPQWADACVELAKNAIADQRNSHESRIARTESTS